VSACTPDFTESVETSPIFFTRSGLLRTADSWKLSPYLTSLWTPDSTATELTQFARFGHDLTRLMCLRTAAHREPGLTPLVMNYGVPARDG
jgi:hypothetical protein